MRTEQSSLISVSPLNEFKHYVPTKRNILFKSHSVPIWLKEGVVLILIMSNEKVSKAKIYLRNG